MRSLSTLPILQLCCVAAAWTVHAQATRWALPHGLCMRR